MTWQMTDSYGSTVYLRFYDETPQPPLVWPDASNDYYINNGQTLSYPLACTPGDTVCYGAENATATAFWGVNIDNSQTCTACCFSCDGQTHAIAFTP
jgi:hypothetical protein